MRKNANPGCMAGEKTVILEDSVIEGDVILPGGLCLFGKIVGHVTAGGEVEIKRGAVVAGGVSCRELLVEGTVEGDVDTRVLIIKENAVLTGKVSTERVQVEGEVYDMKWLRLERK